MNPLTTLPARWRRGVYATYAWVGLALGATQVGFAAVPAEAPTALTVALSVFAFVGGVFGFAAKANTTDPPPTS